MTIQDDNIESFLIGLKELCVEYNLILDSGSCFSDNPGLSKLPDDYEKRFYVLIKTHDEDNTFNEIEFLTQDEIDYWINVGWCIKEDIIIGKLQ